MCVCVCVVSITVKLALSVTAWGPVFSTDLADVGQRQAHVVDEESLRHQRDEGEQRDGEERTGQLSAFSQHICLDSLPTASLARPAGLRMRVSASPSGGRSAAGPICRPHRHPSHDDRDRFIDFVAINYFQQY